MADEPNSWVSIAEVTNLTGVTPTAAQVAIAQGQIEGLINRIWRETDSATRDYYWLKRAVAWQAKHVKDHPELMSLGPLTSLTQDGMSASWDAESGAAARRYVSPVALTFLNNLGNGANVTMRVNSAFQGSGRRRLGRSAYVGWRRI